MDLSVDFLSDLAKFKLSPQHLVLFLLKGCFSLFKSCLEFLLFNLQTTALFVKLMDGASTISKLVKEILDFISKVLVFTLDNIQLLNCFIPSSLQTEELTVVVAAFFLAGINLSCKIINLGFPFAYNLKLWKTYKNICFNMFFKRQISTLFAKAPWSWGRMHNILSCILSEGRKIESRRQLRKKERETSERKLIENWKQRRAFKMNDHRRVERARS